MTASQSANLSPLVSRSAAGAKLAHALRLYVGRGRRYSVKQLANGTGIKDRVIECAMADPDSTDWRPAPPEALLSWAAFLGADFTNEWLSLAGQGAFDLPDDDPEPGDLAIESTEDSATVVRAAMDGVFDPDERRDLKVVGRRKIERGMQLVALSKAA